jgi:WD40 repeat protein
VELSGNENLAASASNDQTIRLWDLAKLKELKVLSGHKGEVTCLKFSSDDLQLFSGADDKNIAIWNLSTGKIERLLTGHEKRINCLVFSDKLKVIVTGGRNCLKVWKFNEKNSSEDMQGHFGKVSEIDIDEQVKNAVSLGQDKSIRIWDLQEGTEIAVIWDKETAFEWGEAYPSILSYSKDLN